MSKGRKPTPDSVKVMKGTNQPCRMDGAGQVPVATIIKLPPAKGLSRDGRKLYKSAGTVLMNLGILNELNFPHFYQYVKETELYLLTMKEMPNAEDMIHSLHSDAGFHTKVKALRKIAEAALSNSRSLAADFGLTPQAQAKIMGMLQPKSTNPLDDFMNDAG